ncbi:hypothetical protein [Vibrio lentus]|uniref:hypothetical protein n=1 Tax=Vibrio lentus TaxID=136468 RepID=UPI001F52DBAC|nr:hypothetical protein [Vibrio lentus]
MINPHRHPWFGEAKRVKSLNELLRILGVAKDIPLDTVGYACGMLATSNQPSSSKLINNSDQDALKAAQHLADSLTN